ncbi:helix-turn-helix domain-containing protein [Chachezhania sediminis]|uniref:helix-turn-helix domain-containing protein n=1 Tax=Chachezhania sediminis TaxID=2599291 RepID=UPI001E30652D|nr:hypothetical protein [Chachezhania sediminis]
MTPIAKATLKQRWGTLQRVLSSRDRLEQIANDIILDLEMKPRLNAGMGNAMLVAGSIPEACELFEIFRKSGSILADKCAAVTSYKRAAPEITGEETDLSHADFARSIGVAKGTCQSWEHGRRHPTGPAQVLLALIAKKPSVAQELLSDV